MTHALVLGGAACLRADVEALRDICPEWDGLVIATNHTGAAIPHLDAWATLHPEHMVGAEGVRSRLRYQREPGAWRAVRRRRGYPDAPVWAPTGKTTDRRFPGRVRGSTGLYAVDVALEMGAERVVLCGVPMDATPSLYRPGVPWEPANMRDEWTEHMDALTGRVRSLSGWTRDVLGAPDAEWLELGHRGP